jgi:hypothetical protein
MIGFFYRRAIDLKDFGESLGHIRIFGIRPFSWLSGSIICLGLMLRDWVSKHPIN